MTDLVVRKDGLAGRITLNRPQALNALTYPMCIALSKVLTEWRDDPDVALVVIDAAGDRAFCSGGDIAEMYASGQSGDLEYGRRFWRDEYRLNYQIHSYPKPIVTLLQGFTMGGGVGVGCHASHRVVCETSQIAMPEVGIGLIPDVGGTYLLAKAPGFLGTYLGLSGARMDAGDAIYAGFADHFVPQADWPDFIEELCKSGSADIIPIHNRPQSQLAENQASYDAVFAQPSLIEIGKALDASTDTRAAKALKLMNRSSPLAMACALRTIEAIKRTPTMSHALAAEYNFTYRAVAQSDFIEGIRAAIIDKDRTPIWQHASWSDVTKQDIATMTLPLSSDMLNLGESL